MRHLRKGKQLGRVSKQRNALMRSLASALIEQGRIKTTLPKAKVLRPFIEKAITKAKKQDLSATRELREEFSEKTVAALLKKWAPIFNKRRGGYTRILKLGSRTSDASPMAYIEFAEEPRGGVSNVSKKSAKK